MREDSARMAAFATGQPTEVYLDDSRSGERVADVYEVDSISYPIDEEEIAKMKMPDLNCTSLESAMSMIKGTARSMGVTVEE